ncbi:hypothetical protein JTE90_015663 [Oedothorax gibbosus]|uniref:Chitin-binding type-2 domain-containing protein n=1 Tax=Oedothorax gibbosus TaxID=931172 RepID=A0AAV6UFV7_9ARAC|nr:hypothetical protein JTE90_015663 [Oedothorax gibbosus]
MINWRSSRLLVEVDSAIYWRYFCGHTTVCICIPYSISTQFNLYIISSIAAGGGKKNKNKGKPTTTTPPPQSYYSDMQRGQRELSAAAVRGVCPKPRGLFPHPESCRHFYQCFDGEVKLRECPAGLLFDEHKKECAYGRRVDCGERIV